MIDVAPGTEVAIVELGGRGFNFATVKTVGKRDIVLDNGDRYRVTDQRRHVGGTWGTTWYLATPDDPHVARLRLDRKIRNVAAKIANLAGAVVARNGADPVEDAAEIAALSARLVELAGQQHEQATP